VEESLKMGVKSKSVFGKQGGKFMSYGTQALASDFAYDRDQKFFKKPISHHIGIFAAGAWGGLAQGEAFQMNKTLKISGKVASVFTNTVASLGFYALEYTTMSLVYGGYDSPYFKSPQAKIPSYLHKGSANMFSIFRLF
jgi:hypothetical protein